MKKGWDRLSLTQQGWKLGARIGEDALPVCPDCAEANPLYCVADLPEGTRMALCHLCGEVQWDPTLVNGKED